MPEARRREVDVLLRGLAPKHQRQLSVSTSNALERFAVLEVCLRLNKNTFLLLWFIFPTIFHCFSFMQWLVFDSADMCQPTIPAI